MKIDSNHTAKTNPYKKGARGPRIEAGLKLEPKGDVYKRQLHVPAKNAIIKFNVCNGICRSVSYP